MVRACVRDIDEMTNTLENGACVRATVCVHARANFFVCRCADVRLRGGWVGGLCMCRGMCVRARGRACVCFLLGVSFCECQGGCLWVQSLMLCQCVSWVKTHTHTHTHTHTRNTAYVRACACMCVRACACTCACVRARARAGARACMHMCCLCFSVSAFLFRWGPRARACE